MKKSRKLGSQLPRQETPAARIASSSAPVAVADGGEPAGPEQGWAPLPSPPSTRWERVETGPSKSGAGAPALSTRRLTVAPRASAVANNVPSRRTAAVATTAVAIVATVDADP